MATPIPGPIPIPLPWIAQTAAPAGQAIGDLTGIAGQINAARLWVTNRHNMIRVLWFGTGFTLILTGLALVAWPAASSAAGQLVPSGKVVKIARKVL